MDKGPQFIYFRQSNGLAYQCSYDPNLTISQILHQILSGDVPKYLKPICRGKLLQIDSNLQANNIKPNQIVHLLALSRAPEQKGFLYLSFQNKIHRVEFNVQQYISDLKKKIKLETGLQEDLQLILFNSIRLEDGKKMKDYEIRSGDFLCMAKNLEIKPIVFDIPQIIFPKKHSIQKRRGSQCMHKLDLINSQHPKTNNRQDVHYEEQIKMHQVSAPNMMSPSLLFGPSPLSQCDFTSFKASMENWIGKPQQVPEESFGETANWLQKDRSGQQKFQMYELSKKQPTLKIEIVGPYLNQEIVLCQSLNYEDEDVQDMRHFNQNKWNNGQKIVPKFAISANLSEGMDNSQIENINSSRISLINLKTNRVLTITELINKNSQMGVDKSNKGPNEIRKCEELKHLLYDLQLKNVNEEDIQFYEVKEHNILNSRLLSEEEMGLILEQIHSNSLKNRSKQNHAQCPESHQQQKKDQTAVGYRFRPKTKHAGQSGQ